ncbi:ATP-dependent helicase [Methanofollis formosanus]|uniref:ATP-dependent helicase n=1 Tax=Methanofollis formosanus TaxID=299308 RepID=A0A8G1A4C2_9EURY|nr:ATP-dependent helicase [Methanofollis formosanus]
MTTIQSTLGRAITPEDNQGQYDAIESSLDRSLFIVAGPGSGKTTVMALRVLKLVYVDGIDPSTVLATTFTKKAATELRSRILGWGERLRLAFIENPTYADQREVLQLIDFNQIFTGTLDSISENILQEYREAGSPTPVIIEDFIANAMMVRYGLLDGGRYKNKDLKAYLKGLSGISYDLNTGGMAGILLEIRDRVCHDQVDIDTFNESGENPGIKVACEAIRVYMRELEERLLYDYGRLEQEFFQKLLNGELTEFTEKIRFILVDEYQDTNLLQEHIYFELARHALQNGGSITVVGDDDQSIYRFRGATVDLFTHFPSRIQEALQVYPTVITLSKNYRSTQNIVDRVEQFVTLDPTFQCARVEEKPPIEYARIGKPVNYPILGMFRDDLPTLARDLSFFLEGVVHNGGVEITQSGTTYTICVDADRGSPADICVLCSSPQEMKADGNPRLPRLLRQNLHNATHSIEIFNPRGQQLREISEVQVLCGLMLECIDPESTIQNKIKYLPKDAKKFFGAWRDAAQIYIQQHSEQYGDMTLGKFVQAWQTRTPHNAFVQKREVPLLDLVYRLVTWIPPMQYDVEGLVYLEVITRTITQSAVFTKFGSEIIFDDENTILEGKSIIDAMRGIFIPLATGAIDINEDLLETIPTDRIPIMSIHQAKGLEYPLVIVDVGSDFKTEHHKQAFKRYPREGGRTCRMEDELRAFSPLQTPQRPGVDRAFDDLTRQYFVAFSRPQDVLLLVGLNSVKDGYLTKGRKPTLKFIKNVATGWDRDETWHWGKGLPDIIHI